MASGFIALSATLALAMADAQPEPAGGPVVTFLRAADANDFAAMEAVMKRGDAKFLKLISNRYLRRVYANTSSGETGNSPPP